MDCGAGHGLEIPVVYKFLGHRKAVDWVAKKISVEEAKSAQRLETCRKNVGYIVMCNVNYFSSQKCVSYNFHP